MIIESKNHQNTTIKFGQDRVKFDNLCQAEVSDELGKKILVNHVGYWEKNKKPAPEVKKVVVNLDPIEGVKDLESQLLIASQKNNKIEQELKIAKAEIQSWKDLVNNVKYTAEPLKPFPAQLSESDIQTIIELAAKPVSKLKEICTGLNLPELEWSDLTKNPLVVYIGKRTLNANG